MNSLPEMLKGLTDVPIALLALLFGILLRRKKEKEWSALFFLTFISGIIGVFVHAFTVPWLCNRIIWLVLYGLLYEVVRRFAKNMSDYIAGNDSKERLSVYIIEGVFYSVTVIFLFVFSLDSIYIFIVFMVILILRVAVCMAKQKCVPSDAKILIILLLAPLLLQALKTVIPYAVVFEHVILAGALLIAYRIGKHKIVIF